MADEVNGEVVAPQADNRKELLNQQFSEVEAAQPAPAPEPKEPKEPKTDARPRDETGKFVAKEPKSETTEQVLADPKPQAVEPAWSKPPKSWKKDYHPLWETADPKLREYAFQREEEMANGVIPLKEKAQLADRINQVAEPYMNIIRGLGVDLPKAVEGLMRADYELRTLQPEQKRNRLLQLAQYYGINLGDAPVEQAGGQPALPPQFLELQGQVAALQSQIEQERQQALMGTINSFAAAHEYYEIAKPFMIDLLNKGEAATLEEAYEKATGPGTKLHDLIQGSRQAAPAPDPVALADKAAKAAKAAAVSVKGSAPGARAPTKAQDRRSMLAEQFDGMSERL